MTVTQNLAQKWKLDMSTMRSGALRSSGASTSVAQQGSYHDSSPPGYIASSAAGGAVHGSEIGHRDNQQHLLVKRAWEMALGPLKQLPMNMFVMYMAGNTISIFPIMMVCMMGWRPIKALMSIQATFKGLSDEISSTLILQKFVYALGNLLAVCLALYKCSSMGLLPTHASDWLDFVEPAQRIEYGTGSLTFL